MIQKHCISNDTSIYEAWPDIALTPSGKLLCVFAECTHHGDRSYTRIMLTESFDRGRSWSPKRPLTEGTEGLDYFYNCPRISLMKDGRLCMLVDKIPHKKGGEQNVNHLAKVLLYFSSDSGSTWSEAIETPLRGIVPDKLIELETGRWIISAHHYEDGYLTQFMRYSDDRGQAWSERITVGKKIGLNLCEVSMLPLGEGRIVAFMRENSGIGMDCIKSISHDNGETWSELINFPLPACHRPVSGVLNDGRIMITYRFMQAGKGWLGSWTQNFFAAISDSESALAKTRNEAWTRIMPIDYDRSPKSDLGYSGWVQFPDGEIYIAQYIVDDAIYKGQIRGYSLRPEEFML
ncbi:MAG: hypothetical protein A2X49_17160 [Lentisphaerae bacterium GWF2_52_8]|nr:MAG: hypothetical protein A2X49_17160 [Lentisphaerae bacterium GWF2_52_8]